jgi:hypothetical protein
MLKFYVIAQPSGYAMYMLCTFVQVKNKNSNTLSKTKTAIWKNKNACLSMLRKVSVHMNPTMAPLSMKPLRVHIEAFFSGKIDTSD